jgi:hypothetical protein
VQLLGEDASYDLPALGIPQKTVLYGLFQERRPRPGETARSCRLEQVALATVTGLDGPDPEGHHSYLALDYARDDRQLLFAVTGMTLEVGPIDCPSPVSLKAPAGVVRRSGGADGKGASLVLEVGGREVPLMDAVDTDPRYLPSVQTLDLDRDGHPDYLVDEGIPADLESSETPRYQQLWLAPKGVPARVCRTPYTGSV